MKGGIEGGGGVLTLVGMAVLVTTRAPFGLLWASSEPLPLPEEEDEEEDEEEEVVVGP